MNESLSNKPPGSSRIHALPIIIVAAVVGLSVGMLNKFLKTRADTPSDWHRREYAGLSVELPGDLHAETLPVPETVKDRFSKIESYGLKAPAWEMWLNHVVNAHDDANLDGSAHDSIEGMKHYPGVSDLGSTVTDFSVEGVPAKKITIRYKRTGKDFVGLTMCTGQGRDGWTITVVGFPGSAEPVADRIFASAKWKK